MLLNNQEITEEIKEEIKKYLETNDNENMMIQNLWDTAKAVLRGKFIAIQAHLKKMWYIYTMEYYSAIKRNEIGSFVETWMDLETVIQSELSQKEKNKYRILMHLCGTYKNGTDEPVCRAEIETQM